MLTLPGMLALQAGVRPPVISSLLSNHYAILAGDPSE